MPDLGEIIHELGRASDRLRAERRRVALINAVKYRLDRRERREIAKHGADGGGHHFTYTADIVRFYERHAAALWSYLLEEFEDHCPEPGWSFWSYLAWFAEHRNQSRWTVTDFDEIRCAVVQEVVELICDAEEREREEAEEAKGR